MAACVHLMAAVSFPSLLPSGRFGPAPYGLCLLLGLAVARHAIIASPAVPPSSSGPSYPWQESTWQQSVKLLVDDALARLPADRAAGSDAERRALAYTRGVLLLNAQPKLQGNIDQARALLEAVRQARADDETGLNALYYLARIAQFHTDPHDPAKAAALYAELIDLAPGHPLAQEAVARRAALRLFEDVPADEWRQRLAECEAAAGRLTVSAARRDLHFVLAEALLDFTDDKEGALRHLLAAEEAGIVRQQLAGDTLVRIAVLARELGHRDVAIAHYRKFLATFQRDGRAYMLDEQLKALEAAVPPSSEPINAPAPPPTLPRPSSTPALSPAPTPATAAPPSAMTVVPTPPPSGSPQPPTAANQAPGSPLSAVEANRRAGGWGPRSSRMAVPQLRVSAQD